MSAQDLEQRARELLVLELDRAGLSDDAEHIRAGRDGIDDSAALRAIVAALRQQPAPAIIDNAGEVASAEQALYPERWRLDDRELNAARLKALHRGLELSRKWSRGTGAHGHTDRMVRDMADELRRALSSQDGDYAHQPAPVVDDAMVDRYLAAQAKAVQEIDNKWGNGGKAPSYIHPVREACRAGLTAALAGGAK